MTDHAYASTMSPEGILLESAPFWLPGSKLRIETSAHLSRDEKFRYYFSATWHDQLPRALVLMLNPSKGRAGQDDATLRRLIYFMIGWKFGGFSVLNLAALVSTDPKKLGVCADPIGIANGRYFREQSAGLSLTSPVVCAWGARLEDLRLRSAEKIIDQMAAFGDRPLHCVGLTKDGHPKHPLYLPKTATLQPFTFNRAWWETIP